MYSGSKCCAIASIPAREISNLQDAQRSARTLTWDGVLWFVYEFVQSLDRRQSPSLIFESESTVRRIRNYPADWQSHSRAQQLECFGAALVAREIGDLLPQHERERGIRGRGCRPAMLFEQSRDNALETRRGHAR